MIRVLQAMAGAEFGGAEAFFERLAISLHQSGLEQKVLVRKRGGRAESLREAGVDVVELPFGGMLDWRTKPAFRREIERFRPDVVLTWMNRATNFCPKGKFVHAARLGGYYNLKYYRDCDHLIGNTEDICAYLRGNNWPESKVHYLPNFVGAKIAPPVHRAELDTPAAARVVLALGRYHPNKAFDILLQAMARVPHIHLWLAGEGVLRAELEALAGQLGITERVRFLGWRNDIAGLFAAADLFVCPSRHEPLGNVVIEAWAHGVPVIAAASAGPAALIKDGIDGLLVPIDDAQALAAALARLVHEPELAQSLAANGRQAFEQSFTEGAVVTRYLEFFAKVVR